MLGHVIDEEHFAPFGLDGKALVRLDPPFRRHKGRIGEDDVGVFVPAVLAGEGVIFVDVRLGEAVQVKVHQGETHHVRGDVVPLERAARRPFSSGVKALCPLASRLVRRICL